MKQTLTDGYSGILDTDQVEDLQTIKGKLIDGKKIISQFRGKLVKMSKDAGSEFGDYSVSLKIRQILLHWGCGLTKKDFLLTQFQIIIYVTSKFNFCKKANTFLAQFQT